PGSSLNYTTALAQRAGAIIAKEPDIDGAFAIMGFSFGGGAANSGMMFLAEKSTSERQGQSGTPAAIVGRLQPKLSALMLAPDGGLVQIFQPPAVQGTTGL